MKLSTGNLTNSNRAPTFEADVFIFNINLQKLNFSEVVLTIK